MSFQTVRFLAAGLVLSLSNIFFSLGVAVVLAKHFPQIGSVGGSGPFTYYLVAAAVLPLLVGVVMRARLTGTLFVPAVAIGVGLMASALLWAWLMTDPIQAGFQMPHEWVAREYRASLAEMALRATLELVGLAVGIALGRWVPSSER